VLAGVADASPWRRSTIEHPRVVRLGDDAAALVYSAHAVRPGHTPYEAAISSVYRGRDGTWELVLHQQTPLLANWPSGVVPGTYPLLALLGLREIVRMLE
jgi:hypothetical protein